jgi:hypothetical protein
MKKGSPIEEGSHRCQRELASLVLNPNQAGVRHRWATTSIMPIVIVQWLALLVVR